MKNTFLGSIVGIAICLNCTVHADVNIQWLQDSYSAFDVTFSGTGLPWEGTTTAPSGLWELNAGIWGYYNPVVVEGRPVEVGNYGLMTFLGEFPPQINPTPSPYDYRLDAPPYNDYFIPSPPIQDGSSWEPYSFLGWIGWHGPNRIVITSIPVLEDPSTWTWTAEYQGEGPSLEPVPEPGTLAILSLGILIVSKTIVRLRAPSVLPRQRRDYRRIPDVCFLLD